MEPAAADHLAGNVDPSSLTVTTEPSPTAIGTSPASTAFVFSITLGTSHDTPTCTYTWNGFPIPGAELGGLTCAGGSNSKTWTPSAANVNYGTAASSGITITATLNNLPAGSTPPTTTETDTTNAVLVDFTAPNIAIDAVNVVWGSTGINEAALTAGTSFAGSSTVATYTVSLTKSDPNLNSVVLKECTAGTIITTRGPPFLATIDITGLTSSSFGVTSGHDLIADFFLEYADQTGNTARSPAACFQFHIDNLGPTITVPGGVSPTTRVADFLLTEGAGSQFVAADRGGDLSNIQKIGLTWTPNPPLGPTEDASAPYAVNFPVSALTPDVYTLTLIGTDIQGNTGTGTVSVTADKDLPVIDHITFDHASCADKVFGVGGEAIGTSATAACEPPYAVDIFIRERFPAPGGGTPTPPGFANNEFTFPTPTYTAPPSGSNLQKWHYDPVTIPAGGVAPFTFDIQLFEQADINALRGVPGITGPRTVIGFSTVSTPQVTFNPTTTIFEGPGTFTIQHVATCPPSLASSFCVPGGGAPTAVELVSTGAACSGLPAAFNDAGTGGDLTPGDSIFTVQWSPVTSQICDVAVKVTAGSAVGQSTPAVPVVVDTQNPDMNSVTETIVTPFKWQTKHELGPPVINTRRFVPHDATEVSGKEIPLDGFAMVKFKYSSFSAREIKFRLVLEEDRTEPEATQEYVDYTFTVETDGTLAGAAHDSVGPTNQVVHLAKGVPVLGTSGVDGLITVGGQVVTPTDGCTPPGSGQRLLWGAGRICYFIIETNHPSAAHLTTRLTTGDNYFVQPIIVEGSVFKREILTADPKMTAKAIDLGFQTPTLTPGTPEVDVSTTLNLEITTSVTGESQLKALDTWVCIIRPANPDAPDPLVDLPFGQYAAFNGLATDFDQDPDCEFVDHPNVEASTVDRTVVRSKPFTSVQTQDTSDRGRRREYTFTVSDILEDAQGRPFDTFYFRIVGRDKVGNLRVTNYVTTGPRVFTIGEYAVEEAAVTRVPAGTADPSLAQYNACFALAPSIPDCQALAQKFRDNEGCFQPETGAAGLTTAGVPEPIALLSTNDNTLSNSCFRTLDNVPQSPYAPFEFPVIIRNDGNVADDLVVTWGHRQGQEGWSVQLVDTRDTPATSDDVVAPGRRLVVALAEPISNTQPTERRILVKIQPTDDALGADFKLINVTVWSGSSRATGNPHLDVFVKAQLMPLRRVSLLLGDPAAISTSVEGAPDQILFVSVKLKNTGNSRDTFNLGIDGPLSTNRDASADPEMCRLRGATLPAGTTVDDFIVIELQTSAGTTVAGRTLSPNQEETLRLRVEVGRNVPASQTSPYKCVFKITVTLGGGPVDVPLSELEPTLNLDITGVSTIKIIELQTVNNDEVDVTNAEIARVVPPTSTSHDVVLFMENTGTVALEPQLTITRVTDRYSLAAQWQGVGTTGAPITIETASQAFPLDKSDPNDPTRLKDNVNQDETFRAAAPTVIRGDWKCLEKDDTGTEVDDTDKRFVCRLVFRLVIPTTAGGESIAVAGDELEYEFSWNDPAQATVAGKVTISLVFAHVGVIKVDSITNRVVARSQPTTITFDAALVEGREFDLVNAQRVPSTLSLTFDPTGAAGPLACTGPAAGPNSFSQVARQAFFRVPVKFATPAGATCSYVLTGTEFIVTTPAGGGTLAVVLGALDDELAPLRQIVPSHIQFADQAAAVNQPSQPTQLELQPGDQDASGFQFARFLYDPLGQTQDGVLLTRATGIKALEHYIDCTLNGRARATNAGDAVGGVPLRWMRLEAETLSPPANTYTLPPGQTTNSFDPIPASGVPGTYLAAPGGAAVTIADNDPGPAVVVAVRASDPFAQEPGGGANNGEFTVTRTGSTAAALTVSLQTTTTSSTASSGTDYTAIPTQVVIPAGSATAVVPVSVLDDIDTTPIETVAVAVSTGTGYTASNGIASVTILDDDPLPAGELVAIVASIPIGAEPGGGASNAEFTLMRTGAAASALTVNIAVTTASSATPGTDYTALPATATFLAGSSTVTVTVAVLNDADTQPTVETVVARVLGGATDVHGQVLRRTTSGQTQVARHVGNVHVYAWGSPTLPVWREGANHVVFYIEDLDEDPALPKGVSNGVDPQLELRMLLRDLTPTNAARDITDRFKLTQQASTTSIRSLGGGYFAAEIHVPEGLAPLIAQSAGQASFMTDRKLDDQKDERTTTATYAAWALRLVINNGKSTGGDDLTGEAYWRLQDLGVATSAGGSLVVDGGISSDRDQINQLFGQDPNTTPRTFLHTAVEFMGGMASPDAGDGTPPWLTGPGLHDFVVFINQETDQPTQAGTTIVGDTTAAPFREHTFIPYTQAHPSLIFQPRDRVRQAGGGTLTLAAVSDTAAQGHYSTLVNLPDAGAPVFNWVMQLSVRDSQNLEVHTMTAAVEARADREAASGGLPMPLCVGPPDNAEVDDAGDFDIAELGSRVIVDLRGIPGAPLLDRGAFALTPFVGHVDPDGVGPGIPPPGVRHDIQSIVRIRGAGLLVLDAAAIPAEGEEDVPITIAVKVTGTPTTIVAQLKKGATLVDDTPLTLSGGQYVGQVTPTELGEHTVTIVAEDAQGGVTSVTKNVNVVANAPPAITIVRPIEVGGERSMKPTDRVEATVADRSITADAISVLTRPGATGDFTEATTGVTVNCTGSTCTVQYAPAGAEDGDTIHVKVRAEVAVDDVAESDVLTIAIDGTAPVPTITIDKPKVTGTPTLVGPSTQVDVSATDAVRVETLLVKAIKGSVEVGLRTISGATGSVTLSELGLTSEGDATLLVIAKDAAGNEDEAEVAVRVDATGPVLSELDAARSGASVAVTVAAADPAGVDRVTLFFRRAGDTTFTSTAMALDAGKHKATVTNPGTSGVLRYYVTGADPLGNTASLGSDANPRTLDLGGPLPTNEAPVVSITAPARDARVSGVVQVTYTASDPDGDTVTVSSLRVAPATGTAIPLEAADGVATFDTNGVDEGKATITIEVTDGQATATASVPVIVDNRPEAAACEAATELRTGDVELCFRLPTAAGVEEVEVQLLRDGEVLSTETLEPSSTGQYNVVFRIEDEGTYALKILTTNADGTTDETTSEPFQVQSAGEAVARPLARFVALLAVGVIVIGLAAFAAFGRWK